MARYALARTDLRRAWVNRGPPLRLFGVVPGLPWLALPPWLVAYLLITLPAASLCKRFLRIW